MDNLLLGSRPPLIRELAGMIFGLVFVLTGGYSGWEFILGLIGTPLIFGGVIRLVVIFYRLLILFLPIPIFSSVLSLVGFGFVLMGITKILNLSEFLGIIVVSILSIAEAWFFIRDVKRTIRTHREETANLHD